MTLTLDHPELLSLLLLAGPIVWLGLRRLGTMERPRRIAALVLRCVVLILLVAMLAGLRAQRVHDDLTVIAVVDESASVRVFGEPPPLSVAQATASPSRPGTGGPATTVVQAVRDYLAAAAGPDTGGQRRPDDPLRAGHLRRPADGTCSARARRAA